MWSITQYLFDISLCCRCLHIRELRPTLPLSLVTSVSFVFDHNVNLYYRIHVHVLMSLQTLACMKCVIGDLLCIKLNCLELCYKQNPVMKYFKLKQLTLLLTFEICAVNTLVQILPRDALQARPMLSCGVCLCVFVTFVHSVKTN